MSDSKHTPGPWRTGRDDMQSFDGASGEPFSSVYATDDRAGLHLGERLPLVIARVHGEHRERDEEKANARLIAAAPELLEAAELTVLHFKRSRASGNFQGDDEHEAWTALAAAIEKATK